MESCSRLSSTFIGPGLIVDRICILDSAISFILGAGHEMSSGNTKGITLNRIVIHEHGNKYNIFQNMWI